MATLATVTTRHWPKLAILAFIAALALAAACQSGPGDAASTDSPPVALMTDAQPGVFDDHILFGQSAALSGPARQLGRDMRLGIQAAFNEINAAGGVHGRQLRLISLDDSYEPNLASSNTQRLLQANRVFALIGEVGTPTSRVAAPLAQSAGVPFLAPFTGAEFLRDPSLSQVVNLRASYYQETEEMVARLTEDLGINRVAVVYQNDSFGLAGLEGARLALERRGLTPVGAWPYPRNTTGVKSALTSIIAQDPQAVIAVGSYAPVAELVVLARREVDPVFMAVSFVGSEALTEKLGPDGAGVYVTQTVPLPDDPNIPVVLDYRKALADYRPSASPGFVSLEGYLAGRLTIGGLQACGPDLSRQCFLNALRDSAAVSIDGFMLDYADDNQGSDKVFLTRIGDDGKLHLVDTLTAPQ